MSILDENIWIIKGENGKVPVMKEEEACREREVVELFFSHFLSKLSQSMKIMTLLLVDTFLKPNAEVKALEILGSFLN